jgi:hypothetical protein
MTIVNLVIVGVVTAVVSVIGMLIYVIVTLKKKL